MILGLTSPSGNSVSWFLCATCPSSKSISIYRHAALELQVDASVRSLDISTPVSGSWELRAASIWCPLIAVVSFPHAIESTLTMIMLMKDGNASSLHTPATSPTRRRLPQQQQLDRIATPNIETDIRCYSHSFVQSSDLPSAYQNIKGPWPAVSEIDTV